MIGNVLQREKERLIAITSSQLTSDNVAALNHLLANPHGLYEITQLKREPRDFSNKEITKEIQRGEQIKPLYAVAKNILPRLDISNESIKYYASMMTCPPKTDPEVVLGLVHIGGRKDGETHTIYTGADHHQIA